MSVALPGQSISLLRNKRKHVPIKKDGLTERQREVLRLLVQGKRMKEIGVILRIAARTVGFHKYRIMDTLNIKSNAELVLCAVRNHVIEA
jgi:DNA-binding NarL/FixJ family response regulator